MFTFSSIKFFESAQIFPGFLIIRPDSKKNARIFWAGPKKKNLACLYYLHTNETENISRDLCVDLNAIRKRVCVHIYNNNQCFRIGYTRNKLCERSFWVFAGNRRILIIFTIGIVSSVYRAKSNFIEYVWENAKLSWPINSPNAIALNENRYLITTEIAVFFHRLLNSSTSIIFP